MVNVRPWRVLSLSGDTLRIVILLAPSAPAVQIFILTMRRLVRSQLIIEIRQRLAAACCGCYRDSYFNSDSLAKNRGSNHCLLSLEASVARSTTGARFEK
jgi:hypothetical protein